MFTNHAKIGALMQYRRLLWVCVFGLLPQACLGTSIIRVSLEEAVGRADWIVSGDVVRNWCAWDSGHRFIWTHTEIAVREKWKGSLGSTVTVSEPGGVIDGRGMSIAGMVRYTPGEHVVVFLSRTPIGLIRTLGLAQGKLLVDGRGVVHPSMTDAMVVSPQGVPSTGTPVADLEGSSLDAVRSRITRMAAQAVRK
jgi:hypothetical protein